MTQTPDMVERVARAIASVPLPDDDWEPGIIPWERLSDSAREMFLREARAAIEAMSEPDTAMKRALLVHRGYDPDAKEETLDTLGQLDLATMHVFIDIYRAMIRAAAKGE